MRVKLLIRLLEIQNLIRSYESQLDKTEIKNIDQIQHLHLKSTSFQQELTEISKKIKPRK